MKKINWKVRMQHKWFWAGIISIGIVLIQQVAALVGFTLDLTDTSKQLLNILDTVFALLGLIGVSVDPTTDGLGDSKQAMTYNSPKED